MTPRARCDDIRREILAAGPLGDAPRAHLAECRACRLFAARLAIVDDGLEADAAAAVVPLPPRLRARILAAAFPSSPPSRAASTRPVRWLDLALRAAAVAAVLVGAIASMPESALAGDLPLREVLAFDGGLRAPLPVPAVPADLSALTDGGSLLADADGATTASLAAAVLLLAAGLSRRMRR